MRDRQLVEATLRGELEAFGELARAYQTTLVASACHLLRSADDAEDLAQEALLTAYTHLRELRDSGKFRPWLFNILRRKCLNHLRSHHAQELPLESCMDIPAPPTAFADDMLFELLNNLPLADREVLAARYLAELEYDEVATVLGCSVPTAYMRCKRARERLRTMMQRAEEEETRRTLQRAMGVMTAGLLDDDFVQRVLQQVKPMPTAMAQPGIPAKPPLWHLPAAPAWLLSNRGVEDRRRAGVACAIAGSRLTHAPQVAALSAATAPCNTSHGAASLWQETKKQEVHGLEAPATMAAAFSSDQAPQPPVASPQESHTPPPPLLLADATAPTDPATPESPLHPAGPRPHAAEDGIAARH